MFKVRGVNMFPRQVEEVLQGAGGLLSEYQIIITRDEQANKDRMTVTVEGENGTDFPAAEARVRELFKSRIGMTPDIRVVPEGTLARSEKKTKRVIDHRYD